MATLESGFDYSTLLRPWDELTAAEWNARYAVSAWTFHHAENLHYQHQAGFLSDEAWRGMEERIKTVLEAGFNPYYENSKRYMRSSFVESVEQLKQQVGE